MPYQDKISKIASVQRLVDEINKKATKTEVETTLTQIESALDALIAELGLEIKRADIEAQLRTPLAPEQ